MGKMLTEEDETYRKEAFRVSKPHSWECEVIFLDVCTLCGCIVGDREIHAEVCDEDDGEQ